MSTQHIKTIDELLEVLLETLDTRLTTDPTTLQPTLLITAKDKTFAVPYEIVAD
jgi:hypothetical protein